MNTGDVQSYSAVRKGLQSTKAQLRVANLLAVAEVGTLVHQSAAEVANLLAVAEVGISVHQSTDEGGQSSGGC